MLAVVVSRVCGEELSPFVVTESIGALVPDDMNHLTASCCKFFVAFPSSCSGTGFTSVSTSMLRLRFIFFCWVEARFFCFEDLRFDLVDATSFRFRTAGVFSSAGEESTSTLLLCTTRRLRNFISSAVGWKNVSRGASCSAVGSALLTTYTEW